MKIKNFLPNLDNLAKDKQIQKEAIINILKNTLEKTYLKEFPGVVVETVIDSNKEVIRLFEVKKIVEDDKAEIDDDLEIALSEASKINKNAKIGEEHKTEVDLTNLERRIVTHFKQALSHTLNITANTKIYDLWKDKVGFIIRAEVEKVRNDFIEINLEGTIGVVPFSERIPGEELKPSEKYLFLIKEVKKESRDFPIILSRRDDRLFNYLLKKEISEVANGLIEIKKMARIAGIKTKLVVLSKQEGLDPVSNIIGPRGERIKRLSEQLWNEKIDVFAYCEDPVQFIIDAVHPSKLKGIEIDEDEDKENSKIITLVCEDDKDLGKLIGRKGSNLKLLEKLTGWSITAISLKTAIEDQVNFQDISEMVATKEKRRGPGGFGSGFNRPSSGSFGKTKRRFGGSDSSNSSRFGGPKGNKMPFGKVQHQNTVQSDYDAEYTKQLEKITDDDIESFLFRDEDAISDMTKKTPSTLTNSQEISKELNLDDLAVETKQETSKTTKTASKKVSKTETKSDQNKLSVDDINESDIDQFLNLDDEKDLFAPKTDDADAVVSGIKEEE